MVYVLGWYRTKKAKKGLIGEDVYSATWWKNIDFGGHSVEELCVDPHFRNLKEELLGSGVISNRMWRSIVEKATRFIDTSLCKKMMNNGNGEDIFFHYDLFWGSPIALHHLCALMAYTDSNPFCTALSETFRAKYPGETIESIKRRNSKFYWSSRYLRELVTCFGIWSMGMRGENHLFYTGINVPIHIPQFQLGLVGPTSTSLTKEIAVNFAGPRGLLLKLKGGDSLCFNAVPFSDYPEENERIFFGSHQSEELYEIVLMKTARNYHSAMSAYSKFDAIFSGEKVKGLKTSALDIEIIKESIRWIEGGEDAVTHKKLDLFILETFYSFLLHKKMVYLYLLYMYWVKENEIINLVMNPLWNSGWDRNKFKPKDTNLMKPFVFNLFRHVHTIRIDASDHPFDLLSFLMMLQEVDLPETMQLIIIEDGSLVDDHGFPNNWIEGALKNVKKEYTAANIDCEMVNYSTLHLKF